MSRNNELGTDINETGTALLDENRKTEPQQDTAGYQLQVVRIINLIRSRARQPTRVTQEVNLVASGPQRSRHHPPNPESVQDEIFSSVNSLTLPDGSRPTLAGLFDRHAVFGD